MNIFLDTETCGFHGPTVLIQYTDHQGEIHLHEVWHETIGMTLNVIKWIVAHNVVGFNLAFDWFHLCQTYTTLLLLKDRVGDDAYPIDHIDEYALCEPDARDGPCLKPKSAFDLMLHARKGEYQSTMNRKDVRIRRIPRQLGPALAYELNQRIPIDDIYFARRKDSSIRWQVFPISEDDGSYNKDFVDIVLKFAPSSALKVLVKACLGVKETLAFADFDLQKPKEYGWAPFALAIGTPENWKGSWPTIIEYHIDYWRTDKEGRIYATNDVVYTRDLYKHFGSPAVGDIDSVLACMVGAVRWRGYAIDIDGISGLLVDAKTKSRSAPKSPRAVLKYISEKLSDIEKVGMGGSTKRTVLETISKWPDHPAASRAQECLDARKAAKEVELYEKLLQAGRFHASFKVIGTLSSRMSGADGLNPQGIKHDTFVRSKFPLAHGDHRLCGGDFSGFEISIADAEYNDPELRRQLCTCSKCGDVCGVDDFIRDACGKCEYKGEIKDGKYQGPRRKIHGLFAMEIFPGTSYDDIVADQAKYDKGKRGVFQTLYGGTNEGMAEKLGIDQEIADAAYRRWHKRYKGIAAAREKINDLFCSMRQPGGLGTKVEWHDPADYVESIVGFRRDFTLENRIGKALFELANKPPGPWKKISGQIVRRDRVQTIMGATMSALYGAAFNTQAQCMRAAANHVIQATGGELTKELQYDIWKLQPSGIGPWIVQPMNIHDELMCPATIEIIPEIHKIVDDFIQTKKSIVPLIKIDWSDHMESWAEK